MTDNSLVPAGNKKPVTMAQIVTSALSVRNNNPRNLLNLAIAAAQQEVGKLAEDASEDERAIYKANVGHLAITSLGSLGERAAMAFRLKAWEMHESGEYLNVRIPVINEANGEPIRDENGIIQVIQPENFEDWFYIVAKTAKLDPTIASATYHTVDALLPAVKTGQITYVVEVKNNKGDVIQRGTKKVTTDDVLSINRAHLEIITKAMRQLLDDFSKSNDAKYLNEAGAVIKDCLDGITVADLKKKLAKKGLRGSRVKTMPCYKTDLPDGKTVYSIVVDEHQIKFLDGILKDRLETMTVDVDDLSSVLRRVGNVSYNIAAGESEPADTGEDADA